MTAPRLTSDRRIQERRARVAARRREPGADAQGRPSYRDPTADKAVGNVMRGGR